MNTKAIKKRMIEKDITMKELAKKIGVTYPHLSGIINGKHGLTLQRANLIQYALDIPNEEFAYYFLEGSQ